MFGGPDYGGGGQFWKLGRRAGNREPRKVVWEERRPSGMGEEVGLDAVEQSSQLKTRMEPRQRCDGVAGSGSRDQSKLISSQLHIQWFLLVASYKTRRECLHCGNWQMPQTRVPRKLIVIFLHTSWPKGTERRIFWRQKLMQSRDWLLNGYNVGCVGKACIKGTVWFYK